MGSDKHVIVVDRFRTHGMLRAPLNGPYVACWPRGTPPGHQCAGILQGAHCADFPVAAVRDRLTRQVRAVKHFPLDAALEPPSNGPSNVPSPRSPSGPISPPVPWCIASRSPNAASLAVARSIPKRPRPRAVHPSPSSAATSAAQHLAGSPTIATSCPLFRSSRGRPRSQRWRRSTWWFRSWRVSGYRASSLCEPRRMSSRTSEPRLR